MYNYGFSYAVSLGEVPYRDFNMIIPPVGALIYSIPFLLFGSNLIVFNLYQALLLCILFYLFKLEIISLIRLPYSNASSCLKIKSGIFLAFSFLANSLLK